MVLATAGVSQIQSVTVTVSQFSVVSPAGCPSDRGVAVTARASRATRELSELRDHGENTGAVRGRGLFAIRRQSWAGCCRSAWSSRAFSCVPTSSQQLVFSSESLPQPREAS